MMVTLFFGGWTLPFRGLDHPAAILAMGLVQILVFLAKMLLFMALFIWCAGCSRVSGMTS